MKQDITVYNSDGQPHGLCIYYWHNGNLMCKRRYVNGIKHGIDEVYRYDGESGYKRYYINDKCVYREYNDIFNEIRFSI